MTRKARVAETNGNLTLVEHEDGTQEWLAPHEVNRKPVWGTQEWAETYSDDLGESPDY